MEPPLATDPGAIEGPVPLPKENVYGSIKRLDWIRRHCVPAIASSISAAGPAT